MARNIDSRSKILNCKTRLKSAWSTLFRPPLFTLNLYSMNSEENHDESDNSDWYNERQIMEAEVNLRKLEMLPLDQENYILSHQICCHAMLFNYCIDEASLFSERRNCSSVTDVGLYKPVSGSLHASTWRKRS